VDEQGRIVSSASRGTCSFSHAHPGWAEQDPEDWWRAADRDSRGDCGRSHAGEPIGGIGLTGQMHGAVLLDGMDWCCALADLVRYAHPAGVRLADRRDWL
jgi:xylulokinase